MKTLHTYLVILVIYSTQETAATNNVCKNVRDYMTIEVNKNCWYNPDVKSSTEEISMRYGYHAEKHSVMTEDGYILVLYRLSKNRKSDEMRQPVVLQYGIGGATEFWVLRGRDSVAFTLCDHGYDVWLTNTRGSTIGLKNERLSRDDPKYWDFCFHENGIYDLPAMIDYISKTTKYKDKLIYMGHSMGTTMSYVYTTEEREHAQENLKGMISLAPVMYMLNSSIAFQVAGKTSSLLNSIREMIGLRVIGETASSREAIFIFCSTYPGILVCKDILGIANGRAAREERPDLLPVFMSYFPTPTTAKSVFHYIQIVTRKKFVKFDYGHLNLIKYKTPDPPEYDVNSISIPIHFFVGANDNIASLSDVNKLYRQLQQNDVNTTLHVFDFAHNDFFIAKYYNKFLHQLLSVVDDLTKIKITKKYFFFISNNLFQIKYLYISFSVR